MEKVICMRWARADEEVLFYRRSVWAVLRNAGEIILDIIDDVGSDLSLIDARELCL